MSFTKIWKHIISSWHLSKETSRDIQAIPSTVKLKKYQYKSVRFGVSRPAAGFFLAPGLGKTLIILCVFAILKKMGLVDELLVLAKKRIVYNVWRQEVRKWRFPFKCVIVHGKDKEQMLYCEADIRLINYEGLAWLKDQRNWLQKGKKRMLAVDESSKIRHTTTQRFRALRKILPYFIRRYIMTGSPTPNGLINIFGQVYALDLGEALGSYITNFKNEFCYPTGYMGYDWKLLPGSDKKIRKKIKPLIIRFGDEELDMPPLTYVDRYVELPKNVRRMYDELEKEYITNIEDGVIVAANAAVASGKLRQIANGGVYMSNNEVVDEDPDREQKWKTVHDEKCEELAELLEELQGEPALVAFEFKHDKLRLQNYFRRHKLKEFANAPFVDGKMKDSEFAIHKKKWDKGLLPVMFGQPESVAHGLNLQESSGGIVIFFAMTWNLENYEQFIRRIWRQGQRRRVIVYRILTRDTVDVDMVYAIRFKDKNQRAFLKSMNRRRKILH